MSRQDLPDEELVMVPVASAVQCKLGVVPIALPSDANLSYKTQTVTLTNISCSLRLGL